MLYDILMESRLTKKYLLVNAESLSDIKSRQTITKAIIHLKDIAHLKFRAFCQKRQTL